MKMRKKHCSVPNCPFEGIPGRSFHEFPCKEIMSKKWLRKIRDYSGITLDLSGRTMMHVCSGHFEEECFKMTKNKIRRLNTDSIPTIFTVRSEMDHCAAKNCRSSTNNGTKLFRFPSNEKMRSNWTKICQRSDSWSPTNNSRLCSLHFSEDQFQQSRADGSPKLKANALPTISVEDIRDKNQLNNNQLIQNRSDGSPKLKANAVPTISVEDIRDKNQLNNNQFKQNRSDGSLKLKANALPTNSVDGIKNKNRLNNCVFLPENLNESNVINDVTFISTTEDYDEGKVSDESSFFDTPAMEVQNGIDDTERSISNDKLGKEKSEEIIIKIEPDHDESLVVKYELLKQEHDDLKRKYETLQKLYTEERGKIALVMLLFESGNCSNKQLQDILKSKK